MTPPPGMLPFVARHYARQAKPDRALAPLSTFATLAPPAVKEGGMPRSANERSTCAASESECPASAGAERRGADRGARSDLRPLPAQLYVRGVKPRRVFAAHTVLPSLS